MKCVIPGVNVKVLAKAIHVLAKIGDEIYFQPEERSLILKSVGSSTSSYCEFIFDDNFFSEYRFGKLAENDSLKCKVSLRAALGVFKTPNTVDRMVESCNIKLQPNATKLIIILKYRTGVVTTFLLPILNTECLEASFNKDNVANKMLVQPKVLIDAIHNFDPNLHEITLDVSNNKLLMRNYVKDTPNIATATRTQLGLSVGEFDTYNITEETCITFCLKEVKAMLMFAESVMLPLYMFFDVSGRPIIFNIRTQSFESNLLLSTLDPNVEEISMAAINEKRQALKKHQAALKKAGQSVKRPGKKRMKKTLVHTRNGIAALQLNQRNAQLSQDDNSSIVTSRPNRRPERLSSLSGQSSDVPRKTGTNFIAETPSESSPTSADKNIQMFSSRESSQTSALKRKINNVVNTLDNDPDVPDTVPGSPIQKHPSKKARHILRKCLQATFDPTKLPGYNVLLAHDTDGESD